MSSSAVFFSDRLGAGAAGLALDDDGSIRVDERLETNLPGVCALGDAVGGPTFTHIVYGDYRVLRDDLLHGGTRTTRDRSVPYAVCIDPQLGRVGLGEEEAHRQGRAIKVATMP